MRMERDTCRTCEDWWLSTSEYLFSVSRQRCGVQSASRLRQLCISTVIAHHAAAALNVMVTLVTRSFQQGIMQIALVRLVAVVTKPCTAINVGNPAMFFCVQCVIRWIDCSKPGGDVSSIAKSTWYITTPVCIGRITSTVQCGVKYARDVFPWIMRSLYPNDVAEDAKRTLQ